MPFRSGAGSAPRQFTMVPDDPGAFTSDHGWISIGKAGGSAIIADSRRLGVRVSLFRIRFPEAMPNARAVGLIASSLYRTYARASGAAGEKEMLTQYVMEHRRAAGRVGITPDTTLISRTCRAFFPRAGRAGKCRSPRLIGTPRIGSGQTVRIICCDRLPPVIKTTERQA